MTTLQERLRADLPLIHREDLDEAADALDAKDAEIEQLRARLADMTLEADSWRANARDSGEEARKYKARLAEAERENERLKIALLNAASAATISDLRDALRREDE